MPPLSSLALGVQTLTDAIQLNPVGPAQGILSASRDILQIIDADKSESQDRQRLAQLVFELAVTYSEGIKKLDEIENSYDINRISSNLFSCLESVSHVILEKPKRGWFARTLGRSATKKTLQGCEADLRHISSILETQIKIRNVKESEAIAAEAKFKQAEQEFEGRVSQAEQETLALIKSQVVEQRRQKLERSSFAHLPPVASPIFFGRSDHVGHLVESLLNGPAYHAILGTGGIGKTSLALNVINDPRIIEAYRSHRYLLACETTADASGIIAGISDIFNLEERSFLQAFRRHCDSIKASMLFLLDNFETPWERPESRPKVEELLTQLCDIPNISIIVTLRGAERPYGVPWTRPFLPTLGPLDFAAARQTFVSIADVSEDDADMATLLEEVDGIPLAITLLGAQTHNPIALPLLQVLSLLPDGTTIEELVDMTPSHFNVHKAVPTILQVALAYTTSQDRINVLAPIREYVHSKHPVSHSLLTSVFSYHAGLSEYAFTSYMTVETPTMEARLIRCIGNIHSVLLACLEVDGLKEKSIKAAINVSSFRRDKDLGSISLLLQESVKHASLSQKPWLHASCLVEVGCRTMYNHESHASAEAFLEESANMLRTLPDGSDLLAFTLTVLTELMHVQGRYEEGLKRGQESVRLIKETTSPVISTLAYMRMGVILMENHNFQEGCKAMDLAASCFEPSKYPILALRYSSSLCWAYQRRNLTGKAIEAANVSLNLNFNMGNAGTRRHYRAAHLLCQRGNAYMHLGRFEDAINDFQETIDTVASYAREFEIGRAMIHLGISHMGRNDLKAASIAFNVALQIPYSNIYLPLNQYMAALSLYQNHLRQAFNYCAKAKGDVYTRGITSTANILLLQVQSQVHIRRGDVTDALSTSVLSVVVAYKLPDRGELARQLLVLGDAYFFTETDIATAKACYQAGLDVLRYMGVWRLIANALMRIGVVDHLQGDSNLAGFRLNQAIGFYEKTEGKVWAEYCKERLRVIQHGIVDEKVPFFPPMFICF